MKRILVLTLLLAFAATALLWGQEITVTLGEDTTYNATTTPPTPYGTYFKNHRQQYLVFADELQALGAGPGDISALAFNVFAMNNCSEMPNFRIRMKHTTQTVLTTTFETGDYLQVWQHGNFLPVEGWNTHNFTTPFNWDGASNVLVDVVYSIIPGVYTQHASVYYTATTGTSTSLRYQSDSIQADTATTGTLSVNRANMQFALQALAPDFDDDMQALSVSGPPVVNMNTPESYTVTVRNMGANPQNSYTVKLMKEGGIELDSQIVNANLEFFEQTDVDLIWTPTVQEETFVYGKVVLTGDENPANDETSPLDVLVVGDPLTGTYTINHDGTGDFISFTSAVDYLANVGVSGPVVFEVAPGTYTEQVVIPEIMGASEINTVTFIGQNARTDAILTFAPTVSAERYIVYLNGAKHVRFENLTIEVADGATHGWGFLMMNACENIEIVNNNINIGYLASASMFYAGIVGSGSLTGATTAGNSVHDLLIEGNTITGGYYSVSVVGATATRLQDVRILNNDIIDAYYYGVYTSNHANPEITHNYISGRHVGTTTTWYRAIYCYNNTEAFNISYNNIENAAYRGMDISGSTPLNPEAYSMIVNNSIGGGFFNHTSTATNGIYITSSARVRIYFNSINMDGNTGRVINTTGTAVQLDVRNNSFAFTGTGAGFAAYYLTTPANFTANDYNNYYSTHATNFVWYEGANRADLAALQAAGAPHGHDQNSLSGNPMYTTATNLLPFGPHLYQMGTSIPGIDEDIEGTLRLDPPSIGAYEFDVPDEAILAINPDEFGFSSLSAGELSAPANLVITNIGTGTITINDGDVFFTGDNPGDFALGTVVYPISLTSGDSEILPVHFAPQTAGSKEAMLQIDHDGDNTPLVAGPLTGYAFPAGTLMEIFEGVFPPEDWTVVNGVTGSHWRQSTVANTGSHSAQAYQGGGSNPSNTANEWLITPLLNIDVMTDPEIIFYGRTTQPPDGARENMRIMVLDQLYDSADDLLANADLAGVASFTTTWQQYNVDLSAFSGFKYLAFNYYITPEDGAGFTNIHVDDVIGPPRYYPDYAVRVTNISGDQLGSSGTTVSYDIEVDNRGELDDTYDLSIFGETWNYTYPASIFVSGGGVEVVTLEVDVPADAELGDNDEIVFTATSQGDVTIEDSVTIVTTAVVTYSAFPYFEDFEDGSGGWSSGAIVNNDHWELGTPAQTNINSAYSGVNAWATYLTQNYESNANTWLMSPPFDFSDLDNPHFSVWLHIWTENNWDGMILESSIDSGNTWQHVRSDDAALNFYNNSSTLGPLAPPKWSGQIAGGYAQYSTSLPELANEDMVYLRFRFQSDGSVQHEGIAVDDIRVWEPGAPEFAINPNSHDFGGVQVGTTTDVFDFTITNVGVGLMNIAPEDIQIVDDPDNVFNLINLAEEVNLGPNESATVGVSFSPNSTGLFNAFLQIEDNLDGRSIEVTRVGREGRNSRDRVLHQIPLSGEGVDSVISDFPWEETFTGVAAGQLPLFWQTTHPSNWNVQNSSSAGGQAPELSFNWSPSATADFYVVTPFLNTEGLDNLSFSFKHYVNHYAGDYTLKVVTIDGDDENLIHEWVNPATIPAETVSFTLSSVDHGVGSEFLQIAWIFSGNSFNINNWNIDDVYVGDQVLPGFIEGNVSLVGGTGNVEDVTVVAGPYEVNPDVAGNYSIEVAPGTYNVTAYLFAYQPEVIEDVLVGEDEVVGNVNFTLGNIEIEVSPDMIAEAVNLDTPITVPLTITNDGAGDLEYWINFSDDMLDRTFNSNSGLNTFDLSEFSSYENSFNGLTAESDPRSTFLGQVGGSEGNRDTTRDYGWNYLFPGLWGDPATSGIGLTGESTWLAGAILDLSDDAGAYITKIGYMDYNEAYGVTAHVFTGDYNAPINHVGYSLTYLPQGNEEYVDLYLTQPVEIEAPGIYWIVLVVDDPGADFFPLGVIGPHVLNACMIFLGGDIYDADDWDNLIDLAPTLDYSWILGAFVDDVWVFADPSYGIVEAGGQVVVDVTLDASGLEEGLYEIDMVINNNAQLEPVIVPIAMTVVDAMLDQPVVDIIISAGTVTLSWDAVPGANSYLILVSDDPYAEEAAWIHEVTVGTPGYSEEAVNKRFYRVVASTEEIGGALLSAPEDSGTTRGAIQRSR